MNYWGMYTDRGNDVVLSESLSKEIVGTRADMIVSEDVMDQPDNISLSDLETEIEGSGIDPTTCVDRFVQLNGDTYFVTKP